MRQGLLLDARHLIQIARLVPRVESLYQRGAAFSFELGAPSHQGAAASGSNLYLYHQPSEGYTGIHLRMRDVSGGGVYITPQNWASFVKCLGDFARLLEL